MNVITVTREYGAGGYEVARRLAEALGWELLDRQLLHQAAAVEHLPDAELERLDEKAVDLADRFRLHPPHERYLHGLREAARQAADRGNVILVGRGTGQLLGNAPNVLHLRLVAPGNGGPTAWPGGRAGAWSTPWRGVPRKTAPANASPATSSAPPPSTPPRTPSCSTPAACRTNGTR